MLKRILYTLLSVLLLSLPWLGGSALTLFVAFVPLLWVEHSLAGQTGRRGKPRRFWPYVVSAFVLWWLATVWWVGYAAVIGVVAATVVGATQMSVVFLVYHAVLRRARRALACTVLGSPMRHCLSTARFRSLGWCSAMPSHRMSGSCSGTSGRARSADRFGYS